MDASTLPAPSSATSSELWTVRASVHRHPWWVMAIATIALSVALVLWAGTRPGYDPYGWLVWGYQTLHLSLDLGGAPSWKPLPYLFTVPYALFGHDALWLWMVTAIAISLSGPIFAGRTAHRLTGGGPAGIVAAGFAGLAVLGIEDYMHYVLTVQSDPMIVALCLGAVDCHLSGRPRRAFALGVLASLGRPEAWPFLALYSVWAWRRLASMRWLLGAGWVVLLFLWFGIPTITNHRPFVAGQLALKSPRALHEGKVIGTIQRFTELQYLPVQLAALLAIVLAALRRHRTVLVLAAGCVLWVVVEIAFALHGWPALPRYVMEPAAVMTVLAAVAVGWVLRDAPRLSPRLPSWTGVPLVALLVVSLVPGAVARIRTERTDLRHERERTAEINHLQTTLTRVGGYQHVRNCGEPVTEVEFASTLAWLTRLNVGFVGHRLEYELHRRYPIVLFTPLADGWSVLPWHTPHDKRPRCERMHIRYAWTRQQPGGALIRG